MPCMPGWSCSGMFSPALPHKYKHQFPKHFSPDDEDAHGDVECLGDGDVGDGGPASVPGAGAVQGAAGAGAAVLGHGHGITDFLAALQVPDLEGGAELQPHVSPRQTVRQGDKARKVLGHRLRRNRLW